VEPTIVLEVAFNAIMRSDRHDSGFALRFPRIVRVRQDKLPKEIDTVEAVEQIYKRIR
jgi:DNA ligase-1